MKEWIKKILRRFRLYGAAVRLHSLVKAYTPSVFLKHLSSNVSYYTSMARKNDSLVLKEIKNTYGRYMLRDPSASEKRLSVVQFRQACGSAEDADRVIESGTIRRYLGIRPINVEMDITNYCNLRCRMCHFSFMKIDKDSRKDMSVGTFKRIAEQIFPVAHSVCLSLAAEPLVNPEFIRMVDIAKEYRVPSIYFTTNGLLLENDIIEHMVHTAITAVTFSIDGSSKETYERIRRGSSFDALIRNIKALVRCKKHNKAFLPRLNIVFVMMRSNIHELPSLIDLAHKLGIDTVHAIHLVSYAPLENHSESLVHDKVLCNRILEESRKVAGKNGITFRDPGDFPLSTPTPQVAQGSVLRETRGALKRFAFNKLALIENTDQRCCPFPWQFVGIDPGGNVHPCGWRYHEDPMGNVHEQSFEDIWSGSRFQHLRSNLERHILTGSCRTCPSSGMGALSNPSAFAVQYPLGRGDSRSK